jgi:hypothetical protein
MNYTKFSSDVFGNAIHKTEFNSPFECTETPLYKFDIYHIQKAIRQQKTGQIN